MLRFILILLLLGCGNSDSTPNRESQSPQSPTSSDDSDKVLDLIDAPVSDASAQSDEDAGSERAQPQDAALDAVGDTESDAGSDGAMATPGMDAGLDAGPQPQTCDLCSRNDDCPINHGCACFGCLWPSGDHDLHCLPFNPMGTCDESFPATGLMRINEVDYCVPGPANSTTCEAWQAANL
jgi:hypothetical protein